MFAMIQLGWKAWNSPIGHLFYILPFIAGYEYTNRYNGKKRERNVN